MASFQRIVSVSLPLTALALGGCAVGFSANVARFQALPPPGGQTFTIQPIDPHQANGLEFQQYAALIGQNLQHFGYQPASAPGSANLVVAIAYGVDHGHQEITTYPGYGPGWGGGPWGYGPGFGWGWGGFGYGRFGGWRGGWGGGWGWGDPFFDYPDVESYTVYTSHLDMQIRRTADGQSLFEGHAKAHSRDDALSHLVPNLIVAMFVNFPGNSGETVRITLPAPGEKGAPRVTPLHQAPPMGPMGAPGPMGGAAPRT